MVFFKQGYLNSPRWVVLLNATVPITTGDLMLETKMKSGPPSLSNYMQRQTHQEHSVCGTACEWQHPPPSKVQQTLQTPLCNPVGNQRSSPMVLIETQKLLKGVRMPVWSCSSWGYCEFPAFHSLQGSGHWIWPAWGFSWQLGTLKHLPAVLHLECDQPMPVRSNWNTYEK